MRRSHIKLLVSIALAAGLVLGAASIASATTRHRPLNARTMSSSYMKTSLAGYANVTQAALGHSYAGGCSYRSFAASYSVDPTSVVNAACRRAQTVVNGRVRSHWMSRSDARSFMKSFRGCCKGFFGPVPPPSTSTTATPVPGYGCPGPWDGSTITTPAPSVPTTPASGYGCPGPWSGATTSTPTVPAPGSGCGGGCW